MKVYVVEVYGGSYEEYYRYVAGVFSDEKAAKNFAAECEKRGASSDERATVTEHDLI